MVPTKVGWMETKLAVRLVEYLVRYSGRRWVACSVATKVDLSVGSKVLKMVEVMVVKSVGLMVMRTADWSVLALGLKMVGLKAASTDFQWVVE